MYESLDFHLTVATLSLPIKAKPTFVCVDYVINVDHRRTLLRKQDSPSVWGKSAVIDYRAYAWSSGCKPLYHWCEDAEQRTVIKTTLVTKKYKNGLSIHVTVHLKYIQAFLSALKSPQYRCVLVGSCHKRQKAQRRKRQSVTTKREKSKTFFWCFLIKWRVRRGLRERWDWCNIHSTVGGSTGLLSNKSKPTVTCLSLSLADFFCLSSFLYILS